MVNKAMEPIINNKQVTIAGAEDKFMPLDRFSFNINRNKIKPPTPKRSKRIFKNNDKDDLP